jgi:hypothetical protein
VLEAVTSFLSEDQVYPLPEDQVYPLPPQPHPGRGIVPEKPVQCEHRRTLVTAYVLARPGKGIHESDVRP